jgi:hypothetical protein
MRYSDKGLGYYATDPEHVVDLIEYGFRALPMLASGVSGLRVLDPCAGGHSADGKVIFGMPYAEELQKRGATVNTVDIRPDSLAEHKTNFLMSDVRNAFGLERDARWDVVISNPPFPLYRQFVERSFELAKCVIFLLPLNVTEPRKRSFEADLKWWREYRPHVCLEHRRMKFGGADSSAFQQYGHFVWYPGVEHGRRMPIAHYPVYDFMVQNEP